MPIAKTFLGHAYDQAQTEARDSGALAAMVDAFASVEQNESVGAISVGPEAIPPEALGDDGTEPPEAPAARPEPKAKPVKRRMKRVATPAPFLPVEENLPPGPTEMPTAILVSCLNGNAVHLLTKILGDPVNLTPTHATVGHNERLSLRTDTDGRGHWRDAATGAEGQTFHSCLSYLLGLSPARAIQIGMALADGYEIQAARITIERKIGIGQDQGFISIFAAAQPLKASLAVKPLRIRQAVDIRFSACDLDTLRGDNEGRLLALHVDASSGSAIARPEIGWYPLAQAFFSRAMCSRFPTIITT
jgi:hypothetical protein